MRSIIAKKLLSPKNLLNESGRSKIFKENIALFLVFLTIFIFLLWETLFKKGLPSIGDFYNFQILTFETLKNSLKTGQFPLWNPFIGMGIPMTIFSPIFYPVNLLYLFLNLKLFALSFYFIHLLIAFFGTYYLAKSLGRSKTASLVAAVILTLSGFLPLRIYQGHIDLLAAASYIPLEFLLINHFFQKNSRLILLLLSPIIGLQLLTGHPQIAYYSLLLVTAYFIFNLIFAKRASKNFILVNLLIYVFVVILGMGFSTIFWLPSQASAYFTSRAEPLPIEAASSYSLPLEKSKLMIFPFPFTIIQTYEGANFLGVLPILLSALGIFFFLKNPQIWFFLLLGVFSLLVAAGNQTPLFQLLYTLLPGFASMRAHVRILIFLSLGIAILSAFGFDYFFQRLQGLKKEKLPTLSKIALVLLGLISISLPFAKSYLPQNFHILFPKYYLHVYLVTAGILLASLGLFLTKKLKLTTFKIIFLVVLIITFFSYSWDYLKPRYFTFPIPGDAEIANYIKEQDPERLHRVWHDTFFEDDWLPRSFNFGSLGVPEAQNLGPNWISKSYQSILNQKSLGLMGAKFIVSLNPDLEKNSGVKLLKTFYIEKDWGLKNFKAYVYSIDALPRFYLVSCNDCAEFFAICEKIGFKQCQNDPSSPLQTTNLEVLKTGVKINSDQLNQVEVSVVSPQNSYLIFNEIYFPGWQAVVNGKKSIVEELNGFKGVVIHQGENTVKFYFEPLRWRWAIFLSFFSIIVWSVSFYFLKKR